MLRGGSHSLSHTDQQLAGRAVERGDGGEAGGRGEGKVLAQRPDLPQLLGKQSPALCREQLHSQGEEGLEFWNGPVWAPAERERGALWRLGGGY